MSRRQIIKLKVCKAVIGLVNDSRKPTGQAVIDKIGGSHSTIGPILKDLKQQTKQFSNLEPIMDFIRNHGGIDEQLIEHTASHLLKKQSAMLEQLEIDNLNLRRQLAQMGSLEAECQRLGEKLALIERERETFTAQTVKVRSAEMIDIMSEYKASNLEYAKQQLNEGFAQNEVLLAKNLEIDAINVELENAKEQVRLAEEKVLEKTKVDIGASDVVTHLKKANARLMAENARLVDKMHKDS